MISQDSFNKIVTTSLLVYCMLMYTLSWFLNRPLNLENFLVLVAPLLTHVVHLVDSSVTAKTSIQAVKENASPSDISAVKDVIK